MKTERRHELQTNDLADWLGNHIEQYKTHLKMVGIGIVAIFVLSLAYVFLVQQQSARSGTIWRAFLQANMELNRDDQAKAFEDVAKNSKATDTALWAQLSSADLDLEHGSELLFSDRELAVQDLDRAKQMFTQVEQSGTRNLALLVRAQFGLAQSLECLGELSKAREKYQQVHKANPETSLGKAAQRRAKRLDSPEIEQFCAWFEKQKPRPRLPTGAGGLPQFRMDDLPDRPTFNLPGSDSTPSSSKDSPAPADDNDAPASKSDPDKADTNKSDTPDAKPGDVKPSDAQPGDSKPGDSIPDQTPGNSKDSPKEPAGDNKPAASTTTDQPK